VEWIQQLTLPSRIPSLEKQGADREAEKRGEKTDQRFNNFLVFSENLNLTF